MILTRHRLTVEPNADFHHFFFVSLGYSLAFMATVIYGDKFTQKNVTFANGLIIQTQITINGPRI